MKTLNNFILEKFKINSKNIKNNKYIVKDKNELLKIISKRALDNEDGVLDLNDLDISNVKELSYLFENVKVKSVDMNKWNVSHIKDIHGLFWCNRNIEEVFISDWNTSNIESFYGVFYTCENLKKLDLSDWKFDNCKEIDLMFANCINLDVSFTDNWDIKDNVSMRDTFRECNSAPKWYRI